MNFSDQRGGRVDGELLGLWQRWRLGVAWQIGNCRDVGQRNADALWVAVASDCRRVIRSGWWGVAHGGRSVLWVRLPPGWRVSRSAAGPAAISPRRGVYLLRRRRAGPSMPLWQEPLGG